MECMLRVLVLLAVYPEVVFVPLMPLKRGLVVLRTKCNRRVTDETVNDTPVANYRTMVTSSG